MIFKRKVYDKLIEWKTLAAGTSAVLLEGARRIVLKIPKRSLYTQKAV